jgi:hypothetical protein
MTQPLESHIQTEAKALLNDKSSDHIAGELDHMGTKERLAVISQMEKLKGSANLPDVVIEGLAEHMQHELNMSPSASRLPQIGNAETEQEMKVLSSGDQTSVQASLDKLQGVPTSTDISSFLKKLL